MGKKAFARIPESAPHEENNTMPAVNQLAERVASHHRDPEITAVFLITLY